MDKETQKIAARFAHELAGPLGAVGHSLEMAEHRLLELLGEEYSFFEAGMAANLSAAPQIRVVKLPKLPDLLARRLDRACEKNPVFAGMLENCDIPKIERAVKVFELGFNQKCARLGLESTEEIIRNLRNVGDVQISEELKGVVLEENLHAAWMIVSRRAKRLTVKWKVPATLVLKANAHALTQVWMNLILNAAQVNEKGCELKISAKKLARKSARGTSDVLEVLFENTGVPLPKGLRLFENGQTGRKGGRGIGLHLCKEIITAHGGNISARNARNGKGVVFKIQLPLK